MCSSPSSLQAAQSTFPSLPCRNSCVVTQVWAEGHSFLSPDLGHTSAVPSGRALPPPCITHTFLQIKCFQQQAQHLLREADGKTPSPASNGQPGKHLQEELPVGEMGTVQTLPITHPPTVVPTACRWAHRRFLLHWAQPPPKSHTCCALQGTDPAQLLLPPSCPSTASSPPAALHISLCLQSRPLSCTAHPSSAHRGSTAVLAIRSQHWVL